ncbi:hypothetical protein TYRP_005460 [Tyrophagus putrescentiae]|nr:hypothetical protein TYRP_005460 [Tyrophagus putrescentiae]
MLKDDEGAVQSPYKTDIFATGVPAQTMSAKAKALIELMLLHPVWRRARKKCLLSAQLQRPPPPKLQDRRSCKVWSKKLAPSPAKPSTPKGLLTAVSAKISPLKSSVGKLLTENSITSST